jgi:multisubunit Na+/H+ antiporter MnhE subunit
MKALRATAAVLVLASVLMALWVLLVSDPTLAQLATGVVVSVAVAVAAERAGSQSGLRFRLGADWLAAAARLPFRVVVESAVVTIALWRRLTRREAITGSFRSARFPSGRDQASSTARRALGVLTGSFAPNTYVVGIDEEEQLIVIHQLIPDDRLPPGAESPRSRWTSG